MDPSKLTEQEKRTIVEFCNRNEGMDFGTLSTLLSLKLQKTVPREVIYSVYVGSLFG